MNQPILLKPAAPPQTPAKSARQRAYEALRAGILRGAFAPGTFLEESVACEETGVSRTPVREALARLGAEGYLVLHPRRGAMVKPVSTEELFDLYDVRLMIETHAVRKICSEKRPVPADLHRLCADHDAIAEGDHLAFTDLNTRFHEALVAASGNKVLLQVFENLRANLMRASMVSFQMGVQRATEGGQHRSIVEALDAHDEDLAVELVRRHLGRMPRHVTSLTPQEDP